MMTPDEALVHIQTMSRVSPNLNHIEALEIAQKALEFMRDHKCKAGEDGQFIEWLKAERRERQRQYDVWDKLPSRNALLCQWFNAKIHEISYIVKHLSSPQQTKPDPWPSEFGMGV